MKTHKITYGSPDQALINQAITNFTGACFSPLSFCTTPVELLSLDKSESPLSHATGFFWHHRGVDFVVTNWHVITGQNLFTRELIDQKTLFVPRKLRVYGWKIRSEGDVVEMRRPDWTVDLGDDGMKAFLEPPKIDGWAVDIAAIPLPPGFVMERQLDENGQAKFGHIEPRINLTERDKISSQAGDDCVLLGYPFANHTGLYLPVWKRGGIATDTNMAVDGSPAFLIDAATSSGMSGSPIFRRVTGAVKLDKTNGTVSEVRGFEFVGVYAGRLESEELERVNVGYGWFAAQVDAAVSHSWNIWQSILNSRKADLSPEI